ncbi:MAG TPA: hypothetical protein VGV69_05880 [Solirubrobacterales bacterium]|nr:hypothetical protein [Solirubrobacterales bacterium]
MSTLRASRKRLAASFSAALLGALAAMALSAAAPASAANCPTFKVLHNDRIGPASLPAGSYSVVTQEGTKGAGLTCQKASQLFTRFLQDWDGALPEDWLVKAEGRGKASFSRKSFGTKPLGFSVRLIGGGGGGNPEIGRLCTDSYTVNAGSEVGPLFFAKGRYALYIPAKSGITCRRASVLFTRFLAQPEGQLPFPWRVKTQTATFYKPEHPLRSAFRVEAAGATS